MRHLLFCSSFVFVALIAACDKSKQADAPALATPAPAPPGIAPAVTPAADSTKPKVVGPNWVAEQVVFEFGEVWAGDMVTYPFRIMNEGTETLKILEAKPRCSCSVSEGYAKEIPPGGSGFIPFKMNTTGKKGSVDEFITVKTNDPQRPEMTLRLRGVVRQLLDIEVVADAQAAADPDPKAAIEKIKASQMNFGLIKANERLQRTCRLKNTSGRPLILKLHPVTPEGSRFTAEFQETAPGEEYLLTVTGDPPFPVGNTQARVPLETNIPGRPLFNVVINTYVPARIDVMPPMIAVDPNLPFIQERTITVTNYGTSPMEITGLAATNPDIKLVLMPKSETSPHVHQVRVTLPPKPYAPPAYGDAIKFDTTDAEMKTIEIKIIPSIERAAIPRPPEAPLTWHPSPLRPTS
ncbi:MAG: DUF1573 domain-containing protein [Planctomycetes bacterium]|nr:DUF1573 domain-containing protein [Planctomycetota bacterium]